MTAIFDHLSPARVAGFVRANGLLGFEARQTGPKHRPAFVVVEHRQDSLDRVETEYRASSLVEACQTARRWAVVTDTEVLEVGKARAEMARLAEVIRDMRGPRVQAVFSFGEGVAA